MDYDPLAMPMDPARALRPALLLAAATGGIAAGILSTLVQVALWIAFTDAFPAILWRDSRLAAAVILGPGVLPPPADPDWIVMAAATAVHFTLSLIYGLVFCLAADRLGWRRSALVGALLGIALYLVNMYGFTLVLPWFAAARDWITLAAHIAFGVSATETGRRVLARLEN